MAWLPALGTISSPLRVFQQVTPVLSPSSSGLCVPQPPDPFQPGPVLKLLGHPGNLLKTPFVPASRKKKGTWSACKTSDYPNFKETRKSRSLQTRHPGRDKARTITGTAGRPLPGEKRQISRRPFLLVTLVEMSRNQLEMTSTTEGLFYCSPQDMGLYFFIFCVPRSWVSS